MLLDISPQGADFDCDPRTVVSTLLRRMNERAAFCKLLVITSFSKARNLPSKHKYVSRTTRQILLDGTSCS